MKPGQNTWLEYQADRAVAVLAELNEGHDVEDVAWLYTATDSPNDAVVEEMCRTLIRQRQVEEVTQRLKS